MEINDNDILAKHNISMGGIPLSEKLLIIKALGDLAYQEAKQPIWDCSPLPGKWNQSISPEDSNALFTQQMLYQADTTHRCSLTLRRNNITGKITATFTNNGICNSKIKSLDQVIVLLQDDLYAPFTTHIGWFEEAGYVVERLQRHDSKCFLRCTHALLPEMCIIVEPSRKKMDYSYYSRVCSTDSRWPFAVFTTSVDKGPCNIVQGVVLNDDPDPGADWVAKVSVPSLTLYTKDLETFFVDLGSLHGSMGGRGSLMAHQKIRDKSLNGYYKDNNVPVLPFPMPVTAREQITRYVKKKMKELVG